MLEARNLLVTCGGRWAGMVAQLRATLPQVPALAGGRLFVADLEAVAPAGHFADATFPVPAFRDPAYVPRLLDLCTKHGVRVVLPLMDLDMAHLVPHHAAFAAAGITLVAPSAVLMDLCFDKLSFESFARTHRLRTPRCYADDALDGAPYPLFHKPRRGFGSQRTGFVGSAAEARALLLDEPDQVFMEACSGAEISVDAYVAQDGRILHAVQRVRDKVLGGEAVRSHTVKLGHVAAAADRVLRALAGEGFHGPANLQFFLTEDPPCFDVNLRLGAGGATLSNQATGGHFFESLLREACGDRATDPDGDYEEGLALYKYMGDCFHRQDGTVWKAFPGGM